MEIIKITKLEPKEVEVQIMKSVSKCLRQPDPRSLVEYKIDGKTYWKLMTNEQLECLDATTAK